MRRLSRAVAALAVAAGVAGCGTSVDTLSFPVPPPTVASAAAPAGTLPGDLSSVAQTPVPGATTTTLPQIGPGTSTVNGTVVGPGGPVAGATVEVDRLVGDTETSAEATTAADGSWTVGGILGGRVRVRAWQSPSLDMTVPQVQFLSSGQTLSLSLTLTQFKSPQVVAATSPSAPILGQPTNLLVQVANPTVGTNGVLTYPPVVDDPVTLASGSGWLLDSASDTVNTDIAGNALFQVSCTAVGADPLSAEVGSGTAVVLNVPPCGAPPTTTTSPPTTVGLFPCPSTTLASLPGVPTTVASGTC